MVDSWSRYKKSAQSIITGSSFSKLIIKFWPISRISFSFWRTRFMETACLIISFVFVLLTIVTQVEFQTQFSRPQWSLMRFSRRKFILVRLSRSKLPLIRLSRHKRSLIRLSDRRCSDHTIFRPWCRLKFRTLPRP